PSSTAGGAAQAFISQGESIGELTNLNTAISVYNVPEDIAISVQDSESFISNFGATEIEPAVEGERRIQLTGEAPAVDEALSIPLRVDFSDGSESITVSLTVEPRAIAPTISSFRASNTTVGQTVTLTATVIDADGNLNASSIEIFRVNNDGSETEVSNVSLSGDTVTASLGSLSAGQYEYRLSASDTEGNSETVSTNFAVAEAPAESGSSGGHAGWLVLLGLAALGLRRRAA
ncbi:MAG: GlyGly-CTERM sorting domain-containing protein, partial [Idiomarina sp.]|nr:GlyGly-CTERM sorting domain-containing protein [Idiomarina sp.]